MKKYKFDKVIKKYSFPIIICSTSLLLIGCFFILLCVNYSNTPGATLNINSFIKYLNIYEFISTIAVIVGAVIAIIEIHANKKLEEASFIKDLNKQFIDNKEMVEIEHALETYNNLYQLGEKNIELELDVRVNGKDKQKLVNYLVYLEGVASIIEQGVLHIDKINSLFGYRYFLAVNNPIIQNIELYPFAAYYQGIFNVYNKWLEKCKDKSSDMFMEVPIYEHTLNTNVQLKYNERIRKVNKEKDDLNKIANLIYQTDNEIYPALFGEDKKEAEIKLAKLIAQEDGFFSYNNILILVKTEKRNNINQEVIKAALLYNDGQTKYLWNENKISKILKTNSDSFYDVSKKYFSKYSKKYSNKIEVIALVVDKDSRRTETKKHYYGFFLLNQLSTLFCDIPIYLEVLENNAGAHELYEKRLLFKDIDSYPGYSYNKEPISAQRMIRYPLCHINKANETSHD